MGERIALSGVPETMLQTVYARARETQTRGALRDDKAVELVNRLDYDFSRGSGQGNAQRRNRANDRARSVGELPSHSNSLGNEMSRLVAGCHFSEANIL